MLRQRRQPHTNKSSSYVTCLMHYLFMFGEWRRRITIHEHVLWHVLTPWSVLHCPSWELLSNTNMAVCVYGVDASLPQWHSSWNNLFMWVLKIGVSLVGLLLEYLADQFSVKCSRRLHLTSLSMDLLNFLNLCHIAHRAWLLSQASLTHPLLHW